MRLRPEEKDALSHALSNVRDPTYLFGSRTDDSRSGGDIDILILSETDSPYRLSQDVTVGFRMQCDEKIDVIVINPSQPSPDQEAFRSLAMKNAVPLA